MGAVARSGADKQARASQPFGQAMPRLTGYSTVGVRLTAAPSWRWMSSEQPVEQKPQVERVVASGFNRAGTLPRPKLARDSVNSSASGPCHWRKIELACDARSNERAGSAAKSGEPTALCAS